MNGNRPLIITGMHRSGTSLVAGFAHLSGIDLGHDLLGASDSNPYGHFEDLNMLEFHRGILQREFGHQMWVPGPPHLTDEDRATARILVDSREHKPNWGWKDPRTCLFLDLWDALLPDARYLFMVRHPDLVVDSLSRRARNRSFHFWMHNTYFKSWLIYNQESFRFFLRHRSRCLLLILEHILKDPSMFSGLLSEWLEFDFSDALFDSMYDRSALTHRPSRHLLASPILRRRSRSFFRKLTENADI